MPVQTFDSDVLIHGSSASTSVWFAPNYNLPIDWLSAGGNPGGHIGFSGNWNNFWGNFVRLPQANCSLWDTVILSFDMSHSYFSNQPTDNIRFYIWDQGSSSYKHPVSHIKINGVESMVNFGVNSFGYYFNTPRNWAHVEVFFDMSVINSTSNVLFYLEPSCNYNNSNVFFVKFDNIQLTGIETNYVGIATSGSEELDVDVFPTLISDEIYISSICKFEQVTVYLSDMLGNIVFQECISLEHGTNLINIPSKIKPGAYLLLINNAHLQKSKRIIRF